MPEDAPAYNADITTLQRIPVEITIVLGWTLMFVLFVCVFVSKFPSATIYGTLSGCMTARGADAMHLVVAILLAHPFVPILVLTVRAPWVRWVATISALGIAWILFINTLYIYASTDYEFSIYDLFNISHQALALWIGLISFNWASRPEQCLPQGKLNQTPGL
jgi:hypothetical protein